MNVATIGSDVAIAMFSKPETAFTATSIGASSMNACDACETAAPAGRKKVTGEPPTSCWKDVARLLTVIDVASPWPGA